MDTTRLEAFSDGVMAVIITIMVLELKVPAGASLHDLQALLPNFLVYALSFQVIGIYWNNHHHLFKAAKYINVKVMWANLNLLFWLSLIPFFTAWFGEHHNDKVPTATFGVVLLCAALASNILRRTVLAANPDFKLHQQTGTEYKGLLTISSYMLAIPLALVNIWISVALYIFVGVLWFIPDRLLAK